ncbi:class I SAM-dependent methyltransferase [Patescibacteria group bacterium]|nr:class I SAM-dependent methyltransferase [Patescibacteria group bacterium]
MKCRICDQELNEPFMSLGNSPLSNSFINKDDLYKKEEYYPLDVYVCTNCCLMQVDTYELAENIFSKTYPYFSSYSTGWLEHSKNYVYMMMDKYNYNKHSFVMEVGSNDGYLLQYFKEYNIPILGVEPSSETAKVAINKGIPTHKDFFNMNYVNNKMIKYYDKKADLIIGNNVIAHNPDLHNFVKSLKYALKKDGIITLEFPHLLQLLINNQFDTIYHEHFSYFSLISIIKLFEMYELEVFDVDEISTHGGSLRVYINHKDDYTKKVTNNVRHVISNERDNKLQSICTYDEFRKQVEKNKRDLLKILIDIKNDDKTIVGYGAPAKGNTLLNYCEIGTDFIDYVVDVSPHKQGKYLPGTHISIYSPDEIIKTKPDYVIILPWNIKDEILSQLNYVKEWGCKFIIPIPISTVID